MTTYTEIGDRIIGDRIIAQYRDFQPKKEYHIATDGSNRKEMTLRKSVTCVIEKAIKIKN